MAEMIRVTPSDLMRLLALEFPFKQVPSVWKLESTVLRLDHGTKVPIFTWLYLERRIAGSSHLYNPASLSTARMAAAPQAIQRLSDHFRLSAVSPKTVYGALSAFASFLAWIDNKEHDGLFEPILSDPELVLPALEIYHRHLSWRIQSHTLHRNTAANLESATLQVMNVIHGGDYGEETSKTSRGHCQITQAPKNEDVAQFVSTLTAVFDSSCRILKACGDRHADGTWQLSVSTIDDSHVTNLPKGFCRARLMELAAISYAGLVIADSGANLAQVQAFEEPTDLLKQLSDPDRINLTQKIVKLRAGGKVVPVTMTSLTFTRLRRFAEIRDEAIELLGCDDIVPFFFQCEYEWRVGHVIKPRSKVEIMRPHAIRPISTHFLTQLRKKIVAAGAKLPAVTLRQLRTHKQQHLVRHYGLNVAADAMGHTIATAVKAYCVAQEGVQANDIGLFMSSLHKTIVSRSQNSSSALVSTPAGECASHGNPKPSDPAPVVDPDCRQTEGCFFCEHFRIHADIEDLRKLLSCRAVLLRLGHLQGESAQADRAYASVLGRIEFLLHELRQILGPDAFARIETDIETGNLTPYWALKVQQLGLLGLITTVAQS
ncbi:hypothetical protein NC77_20365 [Janthinobacterium lividum]|uniref:hypothetical protein n=1 Tax=Janthinobacterium lividum TaxID=29581 RepID=UPI0005382868|nr:hypothetical protein [Janthinobacterium lividum]KHA77245.1 hypothetical protein NC77_20365 [Janthinobacterium lividum]